MNKWLRYLLVIILIFCLILVRKFETEIFYDPFLAYFQGDFYNVQFPEYDLKKVVLNISFRYFLNSMISLGIIWCLFWNTKYLKFSAIVLLGLLIVLLPVYIYFIKNEFHLGENIGFYVRRFLIQPMLLLILIPAFFYQQQKSKAIN